MNTIKNERIVFAGIIVASLLIFAVLLWVIYFKPGAEPAAEFFAYLPALNATFNSLSAICLVLGLRAIKAKRRPVHRRYMLSAVAFSSLFFVSYLIYHNVHGDTPFPGAGLAKGFYLFVLVSHILLSAVMLPLILITLYYALTGAFHKHPKVARVTFPIWLYVSVTGVIIFGMLRACM